MQSVYWPQTSRESDVATDQAIIKLRRGFPLDDDDVRGLSSLNWDTRDVAKGRHVIRDGERSDRIHLIIDGWAARYKLMNDGSRQISAFLLPGDFADVHATLLAKMDHGIVALTPLRVAFIAPAMLDQLVASRARIERALRWSTLVDESILRAWMCNIGRRDARSRIAHLFCELSERLGLRGFDRGQFAPMPLTQVEIGDALGLTPVHVNRVLKILRSDGIIATARGALKISDMTALRRIGNFSADYLHMADPPGPAGATPFIATPDDNPSARGRTPVHADGLCRLP